MKSPLTPGSAYVLLHHVMGELDEEGNWFYVEVIFGFSTIIIF